MANRWRLDPSVVSKGLILVGAAVILVQMMLTAYSEFQALVVLTGIFMIYAGMRNFAIGLLPDRRVYRSLRAEVDRFLQLVRELNRHAVDDDARAIDRKKTEMQQAVGRIVSAAGIEDGDEEARSGTRMPEGGFSLVELLVTIVIFAILAGLSLKLVTARRQAYLAVMQSDLRNVVNAQEFYRDQNGEYADAAPQLDVSLSPNIILSLVGDENGWSGRVQHKVRTDFRCAIYVGTYNPVFMPAEEEGVIACEPKKAGGKGKKK